jgi:DNA-binding MarR family transcriptional regulator
MTGSGVEVGHPVKGTTGYALAKVCRVHRGNVGGMLAEFGLHVGQEMVLIELWQADGLRGGELACRLGVEPPTVTKMLRRLENFGLVERRPDPADARSFRVYLTPEGRALEDPVSRSFVRAEERTLAGLDPSERRELARLLAKMRAGHVANKS